MTQTPLDAMLRYAARGYRVLPLFGSDPESATGCECRNPACTSPAKHPRITGGCHAATTDEIEIRRWGMRYPNMNAGMATGRGLFVLDMDPDANGDDSLVALEAEHGELPETLTQNTPRGGRHFVFSTPVPVGCAVGIRPGLDIRGDGGFIVVAPSTTATGRRWSWRKGCTTIAPAPEWLLRLIRERSTPERGPAPAIPERIPDGRRDSVLASLAGTMRRRGLTADEMLPTLRAVNELRCDPPKTEADLVRIARSMERYEPATPLEAS